jgi:ribose transport system substrate-binding protein
MIEDLTQAQVDVLAFNAVDPNAMISTAQKVKDAGINVLIHSDDLAEQVADHFVGPDQYAGQAAVAQMVASELDGKGTVAILEGVPGNMSSLLRKKGAEETLAKYPEIEVVGVWAANWDRAQGLQKAEDILTAHPDISAIIAVNDEMALGALQAVKARNKLGDVIVTGFNGVAESIQAVHRGDLLATVLTYCDAVGRQLVLTGMEVAAGSDDETYTVDTVTIPLDTKLVRTIGDALGVQ